jgi:hypothetical protein
VIDYGAVNSLWLEFVGGPLDGRKRPSLVFPPPPAERKKDVVVRGVRAVYVWDAVADVYRCRYEEPVQEDAA